MFNRLRRVTPHVRRALKKMQKAHERASQFSPDSTGFVSRVYRGTNGSNRYSIPYNSMTQEGVHVNGFQPRGFQSKNTMHSSIVGHIKSANDSSYVSFAHTPYLAKQFCWPKSIVPTVIVVEPAFIHEANMPLYHVVPKEVAAVLAHNRHDGNEIIDAATRESEVSGFGEVPAEDIARSRQVDSVIVPVTFAVGLASLPFSDPYAIISSATVGSGVFSVFLGKYYVGGISENPLFKSRDFSFQCPSMDQSEYERFVAMDVRMPEGYEAISYPVAKSLHPVLKELEQYFSDLPNQFGYHLVIDCVLKNDTNDYRYTIALIQEVYSAMREATVEKPFHSLRLSQVVQQALKIGRACGDCMSFFRNEAKHVDEADVSKDVSSTNKPSL